MISIDEKIKVFQEFRIEHKDEKIVGKTIYKGYPIGAWAIQIRSAIKKKELILTKERKEKWCNLGILERQIDSTIDEKIDALIKWSTKYPLARVSDFNEPTIRYLKSKAKSEEEFLDLINQYKKMKSYYEYITQRNSNKCLSKEQKEKLIEGNVGGVFLDYGNIKILSSTYRISQDKMYALINRYSNINIIKIIYKDILLNRKTDNENINPNLRRSIDVRLNDNKGFETLFLKITEGSNNIVFDSQALLDQVNALDYRIANIIKQIYGLENGVRKTGVALAEELNISDSRIQQLTKKAIEELKKPKSLKKIIIDTNKKFGLSSKEVIDLFINTDFIFYPDKEYIVNPNQTYEELIGLIKDKSVRVSIQNNIKSILEKMVEMNRNGMDVLSVLPKEAERKEYKSDKEQLEDEVFLALNKMSKLKEEGVDLSNIFEVEDFEQRIKYELLKRKPIECCDFSRKAKRELKECGILRVEQLFNMSLDYIDIMINRDEIINEIRNLKNREECKPIFESEKRKEEELFNKIKDEPIELCGFYLGAQNALKKANVDTIGKLFDLSIEEIEHIRGIGDMYAYRIKRAISFREKLLRDAEKRLHEEQTQMEENKENLNEITGKKIGQVACSSQAIAISNKMEDVLKNVVSKNSKKEEK